MPLVSTLVHAGLVGIWIFTVYAQSASDTSDPLHPQNGPPWYITKSCSVSSDKSNIEYCRQAKAAFAVSVILLYVGLPQHGKSCILTAQYSILFITNTVFAAQSMIPSKEQKHRKQMDRDEDAMLKAAGGGMKQAADGSWELREFPLPPTEQNRKGLRASVKSVRSLKSPRL